MTVFIDRLRILWALYRPVRGLLAWYVVAALFGTVMEGLTLMAIVPLIGGDAGRVGEFFDSMLRSISLNPTEQNLIILVGALVVLRAVTKYAATLLAGLMVRREAVRLQIDLFRAYLQVDWEVAVGLTKGELQLLLTGQTKRVSDFLGQLVLLLESLVFVAGLTVAAVVVSPSDTFLAIALIGVTGVIVGVLGHRIQQHAEGALRETKAQSSALMQFARGAFVLRSFGVTNRAMEIIERQAEDREHLTFRSQRAAALAVALPDLLFVLALLVVVSVSFRSGNGVAEVTAVIALLYRISQYLKRFSGLAALRERVPDLRDVHRNLKRLTERRAADPDALVDPELAEGAVELDNLTFTFAGSDTPAVDDVSATIAPGEFIGVVGPSGGGKSTLVHQMAGLIRPTRGAVRIGGRDRTLAEVVAFVPQVPFIIGGSVAENIRWLRRLNDEALWLAADRAGLSPVIERLPNGMDTQIAEEGLTLSGGERQRLALARALAGSPLVLILDEATSALDSESEAVIQRTLEAIRGTVTVVSVAHRLSTVVSADRVWVMERGRLVEDEPPADLLRRPDSRFAKLGALQGFTAPVDDEVSGGG